MVGAPAARERRGGGAAVALRVALACAALLVVALLVAAPAQAQETSIVPPDWALKPADIRTGEPFRLLAITKKRSLKSWSIEDYNTFVQQEVAGDHGHEAIRAYGESFRVVASSSTVDARDNTGTNPEQAVGVPIYWLNGARVADDNADFYDGAWQNHADLRRTNGSTFTANQKLRMIVGTGSNNDGTKHASDVLGADFVRTGDPYDGEVLNDGRILGLNSRERLYALSPVFRAIDAGVPYVAGAAITSDAGADREYATGDEVRVAVTFSEAVTVSGSPQLALEIGSDTRQASYRVEESTDTVLVFGYTVTAADHDNDGIAITGGGLSGGAITKRDAVAVTANRAFHTVFGQPAHRVHSVPTVVSVDITSTPRSEGATYGLGETIEVTVTFSDPLVVDRTGGTPELALRLKITNNSQLDRTAAYLRTSGPALVFGYVVAAGDEAIGIVVRQDTLATGGATIRNALTGRDADLRYSVRRFPGRVDATLTPPASADATLAALSIDGMTLSPAFDPATREYTAAPRGAATSATVAATARDQRRHRGHRAGRRRRRHRRAPGEPGRRPDADHRRADRRGRHDDRDLRRYRGGGGLRHRRRRDRCRGGGRDLHRRPHRADGGDTDRVGRPRVHRPVDGDGHRSGDTHVRGRRGGGHVDGGGPGRPGGRAGRRRHRDAAGGNGLRGSAPRPRPR